MMIFILFFTELMAMRFATFGRPSAEHSHTHALESNNSPGPLSNKQEEEEEDDKGVAADQHPPHRNSHQPGQDHLSHTRDHPDSSTANANDQHHRRKYREAEDYAAQMTAIFILEFGVIFHSIFIGLTLAVAGDEFTTLYVVLVFHQTFEGLGLGSRLAVTPWPPGKRSTAYWFAVSYGLSTPVAMAVGLGLRETYAPGSATALVINGVFDSISAGILIYTGLVELMAHEFIFSATMKRARIGVVMAAFGIMVLGAGESCFPFFCPSQFSPFVPSLPLLAPLRREETSARKHRSPDRGSESRESEEDRKKKNTKLTPHAQPLGLMALLGYWA